MDRGTGLWMFVWKASFPLEWRPLISLQSNSLDIVLAGVVVGSLIASDRIIVVTGIRAHFTSERLNVNPLELLVWKSPSEMHYP
jgi:hypothetical protein